jgi:hypothetical protein
MDFKKILLLASGLLLPPGAAAELGVSMPIQIRAVLQDPMKPTADLFVCDSSGSIVQLELRPKDLSSPLVVQTINDSIILYDKPTGDPHKTGSNLAATCKVPAGSKTGVIIILPSAVDTKPAYRVVFIDDSAKAFPKGESRILTLLPVEVAIEAGEHKLPIRPGEITRLPPVKKVDEFNLAQTNFYFKKQEVWSVFIERQLQFADKVRRIFIVHRTPGALDPTVSTILDASKPQ